MRNCVSGRTATLWKEVQRGRCKPSPVGSTGDAPENFAYLAFCGAQNIIFVVVCDDKQLLKLTSEIREKTNKIPSIKASII